MNQFPAHTLESAPPLARPTMEAVSRKFGFLPGPVARLATSPELLNGFLRLSASFESCSLPPLARETLIMTIATRNACHVCVAMHSATLHRLDAPSELIDALRGQRPVDPPELEAIRLFTLAVLERAGAVTAAELEAFLTAGYSRQHALEVVLGIGAYTMSTLANRLTDAPLDEVFEPFGWHDEEGGQALPDPRILRS